jgi:hypothetical protein
MNSPFIKVIRSYSINGVPQGLAIPDYQLLPISGGSIPKDFNTFLQGCSCFKIQNLKVKNLIAIALI